MNNTTEWATIGKIVAPFGIRGELKVLPLSDIPDRFLSLKSVYVGPSHQKQRITGVRPYKGEMVLLKLEGLNDATLAETLRGRDLCIPIDELAELPPDSYYQHDILGLQVRLLDDREIGEIVEIIDAGPNDVYAIKVKDGRQFLIPAVKEFIKQIDLIRHVMYIDPIKGLLDDEALFDYPNQTQEDVDET
jgi:16S rRNA processing protein RimM